MVLIIFWALLGVFLMIVGQFFIPMIRDFFNGSWIFLIPFMVFFLLGIALVFVTFRTKTVGPPKKFLILTGVSAAGFFVSVFLHNAFYALAIVTSQIVLLNYLMKVLDIAFFFIAIFVCPISFLVGAIGCLVLLTRSRI